MHIKKVFLSYKRSVYELYVQEQETSKMARFYKAKHPITSRIEGAHKRHRETLSSVQEVLDRLGIDYDIRLRGTYGRLDKYDLVITVGGDGTFLQTAHSLTNQLILGVNSNPVDSIGAHCSADRENFEKKLSNLMQGKEKIIELTRLALRINGKTMPTLALNEILFTHECPAGTTRYIIQIDNLKEEQRSSGIWIATAIGSTAVIESAGGTKLPASSKKFQYVVREPFEPKGSFKLKKGVLKPKEKLILISKMVEGYLYVDGANVSYPLSFGDKVEITTAKYPLRVVQ